ncbi:somatostatin receptor type 2-like [Mytilus trossulus]|uniref:somatostatin receptor type 2-like n=1 Tax=Mytilus trossulus TaxID=6551 RepID=UPI003006A860
MDSLVENVSRSEGVITNFSYTPNLTFEDTTIFSNISTTSNSILDYVNMVSIPICLITGVLGNTITIILMNTKTFSHFASKYFLIGLAIADTSVLLTQPFKNMFVIRYFGVDLRALSTIGCKFYFCVHRAGKMMSSWFVVYMALERLAAVRFPLKVKIWFSKRNTLIGVGLMMLLIIGFTAGYSYCTKIDQNNICNPDVYDRNDSSAVMLYRQMLNTGVTLYFIGPLVILLIATPTIIISLIKHEHDKAKLSQFNAKNALARPTAMLLSVMFAYIIFVTPIGVVRIIVNYHGVNLFAVKMTWFSTFRDISHFLELINYSINFFLYACTSRQFRRCLTLLLCTKKITNRQPDGSSTGSKSRSKTGAWFSKISSD